MLLNILGMSGEKVKRWLDLSPGELKTKRELLTQLSSLQDEHPDIEFRFSSEEGARLPEVLGMLCYPTECLGSIDAKATPTIWVYWGSQTPNEKMGVWERKANGSHDGKYSQDSTVNKLYFLHK